MGRQAERRPADDAAPAGTTWGIVAVASWLVLLVAIPTVLLISAALDSAHGAVAASTIALVWSILTVVSTYVLLGRSSARAPRRSRPSWGSRLGAVVAKALFLCVFVTFPLMTARQTSVGRGSAGGPLDFGDAPAELLDAGRAIGWLAVVVTAAGVVTAAWLGGRVGAPRSSHDKGSSSRDL